MSTQLDTRALQSETIGAITKALVKVQQQLEAAKKTAVNPFFNSHYADFSAVVSASRSLLTDHGLAVTQLTCAGPDGQPELVTTVAHESGEWFRGFYPVRSIKGDPQSLGSAVTYARRYTYSAAIGIVTEDDDGNAASAPKTNGAPMPNDQGGIRPKITQADVDRLKQDVRDTTAYPHGSAGRHAYFGADKASAKAFRPPSDKQLQFLYTLLDSHSIPESSAPEVVKRLSGWPEMSSKNVSKTIEALKASEQTPDAIADLKGTEIGYEVTDYDVPPTPRWDD